MQAELASFGADVLLAAAGFGVLLAIGLTPRGVPAVLGAVGLAYLIGTAVVPLVLTLLLVLGVPLRLLTAMAVVAACVLLGAWRAGPTIGAPSRIRKPDWRAWEPDTWVILAFVVVFGGYAIVGLLNALEAPLVDWDAWTIWGRKAQLLTLHDTLWDDYFQNPVYYFSHLDYPLQLPVWEAIHFRAGGEFDMGALLGHIWLLPVAFVWAAAYLVHTYGRVRSIVWAPVLLLVATAPGVWEQATGDADLPLAMFASLALLAMAFWLAWGDRRLLVLAAIMLAATANTKNEGAAVAVAVLAVALVIVLTRKLDLRAFLLAAGGVAVVGVLPWRIWLATQNIEGDIPVGKGLNPGYLVDRIGRVGPSIEAINAQLADQGRWAYLVPLAALLVLFSLVSGLGRRLAAFYLAVFLFIWAVFVWSYWISPYDLEWHIETSVFRIVSVLVLICAAAVLHLSGIFVAGLGRSDGRQGASSSPSPPSLSE